jgi:hypothetical protein
MRRIIVVVAAIGTGLAWAVRRIMDRPGAPPVTADRVGPAAQDEVWRNAERETTTFRMRSGPGPM